MKFVKPGKAPAIRIWAEARAGDYPNERHPRWRIWFADEGIGIPREMLPRVFDMFSRASRDYEGTGIGLALVRKVVQRMGGRVGVESEEGAGSRFWVELKAAEPGGEDNSVVGASESKKGTVLYVEDEECDAVFMARAFAGQGMASALRVVSDGSAAIAYLSGTGNYGDRKNYPFPALVLLDLNLPLVPGFEVLQWIRKQPALARTPVVVFTSSAREDDRVKARELGAQGFVAKPSSALEFGRVVEQLREQWLV